MLRKLFVRGARKGAASSAVPPGQRVYAIGDIHGCLIQLKQLLDLIAADEAERGPADTVLIFVGDLVDRGPDSAGVIDRLMRLVTERPTTRFLYGNHEEIFLKTLDGEDKSLRMFCRVGGRETAISYGIDDETYNGLGFAELQELLVRTVPAEHRAFLEGFEDLISIGDYTFVHAGVRPDLPLAEQSRSDLRWMREPFISSRKPLEQMIVHGHTITNDVEQTPARIGIDTGAYITGVLSAIGLEGTDRWVLQTPRTDEG